MDFLYECKSGLRGERERVLSISFVCKYICEYACFGKMQYSTPRFCPHLVLGYREEGSCFIMKIINYSLCYYYLLMCFWFVHCM